VSNLAVVLQMYRQILNVDAAFGIFVMDNDRCLVIGRSSSDGINIAGIMQNMGGGGHPGAGSALLKFVNPADVEAWIRVMVGESRQTSEKIRDHMSHPVVTLHPGITMEQADKKLREKGYKGAPVVENGNLLGMLSRRDFQKIRKKSHLHKSVKAFMSVNVVTISPGESLEHAARLMIKQNIGRLPVVDDGKIIGIFSRTDAVADFYGFCPLDSGYTAGCKERFSASHD
jgi:tRNA nucleotidyltransferase (CCA-adding enzyme)